MAKKTYTFILLLPLMMFFLINGTILPQKNKTIFEAGTEMVTKYQKVNYLLPDNEINLPENEMIFTPRKYKIKDAHKFSGKRFTR